MCETRYFNLEFGETHSGHIHAARFGFWFNGVPVKGVCCLVSGTASYGIANAESETALPAAQEGCSPALPKAGGISREELFGGLALDYGRASFLKQVHGQEVFETGKERLARGEEGDGLISIDRSVVLSVTVADCLPIYLYDTESGALGLLHSGWKGTGIVLNALDMMRQKWGTRPAAVSAVLGPCISAYSYRVDRERAMLFDRSFGRKSKLVREYVEPGLGKAIRRRNGEYFIDLRGANTRLLYGAGVKNISVCLDCTFSDTRLGSFRREGPSYTRMNALAWYS